MQMTPFLISEVVCTLITLVVTYLVIGYLQNKVTNLIKVSLFIFAVLSLVYFDIGGQKVNNEIDFKTSYTNCYILEGCKKELFPLKESNSNKTFNLAIAIIPGFIIGGILGFREKNVKNS